MAEPAWKDCIVRTLRRLLPTLVLLCAAAWPAVAPSADWPQWGGRPGRNMVSDEKGLPDSFVPGERKPMGTGIDLGTTRNVRWSVKRRIVPGRTAVR